MHCRSVICAECTTRLEGINYCHACLRDLGRKSDGASAPRRWRWLTTALLLGGAWIFFALWGFGCRGSRSRTRYPRYPRRGW